MSARLGMLVAVAVAVVRPALADDALQARARAAETAPAAHLELEPEVLSRLEGIEGIGALADRHTTAFAIGKTRLALESMWWIVDDRPERPLIDVAAQGWRAGARFSRELGAGIMLEGHAMYAHAESRFGTESHATLGISLIRRFRLSRWMTAWISLGVGHRVWLDGAPTGETRDTTFMLRIGTTFR